MSLDCTDWTHGHNEAPHTPGYLYDCEACEDSCHCGDHCITCHYHGTDECESHTQCVFCALLEERYGL